MKKFSKTDLILSLIIPITFLVISILTLSSYGINWDEPKHLIRGQSYLNFILTGKKDFLDLPPYPKLKGAPDYIDFNASPSVRNTSEIPDPNVRRSYFQSDYYTFDYFMTKHEHTHPEINGLLAAFSNYIFYQKLGIIGDLEAYHIFIVLVTFSLLAAIGLWIANLFGIFPSIIVTASLALYPLVFAESHFNIKDPVLMSFFGLTIISFVEGIKKDKPIYLVLSSVMAGFAMGTKFNALFLCPMLGIWLLFIWKFQKKLINKKILIFLLFFPVISLFILYIFSPYLWADPLNHFLEIVKYYKSIGTEMLPMEMSRFIIFGWNTYPVLWIFYTTPLPIIFLSIVGFCYAISEVKKNDIALLILLWFIIPIIRVMWPGANIYGGVRQIMEFVPALAILSGLGALFLIKKSKLWIPIILIAFIFVTYEMVIIHPNQNVYFNQLTGGLAGAKEKSIPSWGNTYGNVYLQGINWLNENVEPDAKLALAANYISVIPRMKLRSDIDLNNSHFSGMDQKGEYAMEMYFDWPLRAGYKYSYYETFLNPVYQVTVDGVPILKIWKNDPNQAKKKFEEVDINPRSITFENQKIKLEFEKEIFLTRLIIDHGVDGCNKSLDGFIEVSEDGNNFTREPGPLFNVEAPEISPGLDENTFVFLFPARPAVSIILNVEDPKSCILKDARVEILGLTKSPQ